MPGLEDSLFGKFEKPGMQPRPDRTRIMAPSQKAFTII